MGDSVSILAIFYQKLACNGNVEIIYHLQFARSSDGGQPPPSMLSHFAGRNRNLSDLALLIIFSVLQSPPQSDITN